MSDFSYGIHAVSAALKKPDSIVELYLEERSRPNPRLAKLIDQAKQANVTIRYVERDELEQMADGERHQGIVVRLSSAATRGGAQGGVWRCGDHTVFSGDQPGAHAA